MRLWFVHSGEVSLQDQIVTQISLGILTRELAPGERLPSVRELARRFKLHPNTVSLAYRRLDAEGWVEARRGSGVYVRTPDAGRGGASVPGERDGWIDRQIAGLVESARTLGVDAQALRERFLRALEASSRPAKLVLVEADAELARIVAAEIWDAAGLRVEVWPSVAEPDTAQTLLLAMPSKVEGLRAAGLTIHAVRVRGVAESLAAFVPFPRTALVGIVSGWPRFLELARTMLVAAGFDPDALVLRDARAAGAVDGLSGLDAVVCDALTARAMPKGVRVICFRLLADEGLRELREWSEAARASSG
jgi:DNA-binding transcriptional regulator YhcF (GntR family)